MFDIVTKELDWNGTKLTLETGKIARQADGAVMVTYGDTKVLCTVVAQKKPKPDIDFFPLTVNYQEKTYAAGKIPGGFFKRETRPSEFETLTSRLIDRPIRPLFHSSFKNETQVICTVVQHDGENAADIPAMIGASAALTISGVPFMGPIAGARVGYVDGEYVLNPTPEQQEESKLDLVVASTRDSVLMVESEADELSEEIMLGAVVFGQDQMQPVIDLIIDLAEDCAKPAWDITQEDYSELEAKIAKLAEKPLREAYAIQAKQERSQAVDAAKTAAKEALAEEEAGYSDVLIGSLLKKLESDIVRGEILKSGKRIDGRDTKTVRPIVAEVDILPRTHGSALFTRGETQALVVATLGTAQDEQIIDGLQGDSRDHFLLHYNFPPYSVGEASMLRAPGRREIGHGKLAKRALAAILPTKEEFPYTIRLVSEITESNGSSSMASVCGGALAMMAAGVPVKGPVAGIAMGLIKEGDEFSVLSDIMGDEDHLGDMDFKVAGTKDGINALQMDIKINGITREIMEIALKQAQEGRLHILGEMAKAMEGPREDVSDFAPKMTTIQIDKDKIREVIGTGGKVIRELTEETGTAIDIEQDGTIRVSGVEATSVNEAIRRIEEIVAEPEVGKIYDGEVMDIVDFGAFVQFLGPRQGLVHISELAFERVEKVTDVLEVGQKIKVKCIGMDRGKVKLSYRFVDQETGEEVEPPEGFRPPVARPDFKGKGGDRKGGRGGDKGRRSDDGEGSEGGQRRRRPF